MEKLKILTYNIRGDYDDYDKQNSFIFRAGRMLDKIKAEKPHVICFQEITDRVRVFLETYLTDYTLVGHGRMENYDGEGLTVAFKKDCMELFSLKQFWLSETPYVPASRFEIQSNCPRICPCVVLRHKNAKTPIRIYNVHLDHVSDAARILGIKQIMEDIINENKKVDFPTIIMGDFNAFPESETISYVNNFKEYPMIDVTKDSGATFHAYNQDSYTGAAKGQKIDYIFIDEKTASSVSNVQKWTDELHGIFLSDHYPMCCELEIL